MLFNRSSGLYTLAIALAGQHPVYQVEVTPFHNTILHTRHNGAALLGEPFGVVLYEVFGVFPGSYI